MRPAGVQLQPATFNLKVFYAEDLPRSKSDCYCTVVKFLQNRILLTWISSGLYVYCAVQIIHHVLSLCAACINFLFVFIVDSDFLQGVKKVFGSDEKKEFVDPYFIAGFAGTKVCIYLVLVYCNLS